MDILYAIPSLKWNQLIECTLSMGIISPNPPPLPGDYPPYKAIRVCRIAIDVLLSPESANSVYIHNTVALGGQRRTGISFHGFPARVYVHVFMVCLVSLRQWCSSEMIPLQKGLSKFSKYYGALYYFMS